jgi:DNA-directed RNA polymerase specialized sigma54-like protein
VEKAARLTLPQGTEIARRTVAKYREVLGILYQAPGQMTESHL